MEQNHKLNIVMTTELQQAIQLLQFSTYELIQFIQEQADENPFMELTSNDTNAEFEDKYPSYKSSNQELDPLDFVTDTKKSLHEHLLEQIRWMDLTDDQYKIVHYLVLNIDNQGYLTLTDEEIAEYFNLNESVVKQIKEILYQLEPLGIGGINLSECLLIQAYQYYPEDDLLHTLIEENLSSLADKQWMNITNQYNVTLPEINEEFRKIQTLNPRPASIFEEGIDYITPDITVKHNKIDNKYQVQLNDHYVPDINFNRNYADQLSQSKDMSQYIKTHFRNFEWLQRSIMQRRHTITKIMEVVIRHQRLFLNKGVQFLKPLTLKDVATEIDMHESTVSRATSNKIIETPAGTFQLRYLFSTKLSSSTGNNQSQTTVKALIRELVQKENKYKPLSDQKIVEKLKQKYDVEISRRTVAKYRFELQIFSSTKRKEIKVV